MGFFFRKRVFGGKFILAWYVVLRACCSCLKLAHFMSTQKDCSWRCPGWGLGVWPFKFHGWIWTQQPRRTSHFLMAIAVVFASWTFAWESVTFYLSQFGGGKKGQNLLTTFVFNPGLFLGGDVIWFGKSRMCLRMCKLVRCTCRLLASVGGYFSLFVWLLVSIYSCHLDVCGSIVHAVRFGWVVPL